MKRIFVHRYRWSHEARRRQLRRAVKDGEAKMIEKIYDGWLYEVPDNFNVKRG